MFMRSCRNGICGITRKIGRSVDHKEGSHDPFFYGSHYKFHEQDQDLKHS